MTKQEFLSQLRDALNDELNAGAVEEQVNYYNSYISEEVRNGKSEEEVLEMLGDPWILARTITDAADGTDQQTAYEFDSGSESYSSGEQRSYGSGSMREIRFDTWWKKLLLVLVIVMVVLLVVAVVTGLIRILAPILVPVLVIMLVVRLIGGRRS